MKPDPAASQTTAEPDVIRDRIATVAQACLDHVRSVTWGEGHASYVVNDDGIETIITVSVKSLGRKEKTDAKV